jgi:hypothetical protein
MAAEQHTAPVALHHLWDAWAFAAMEAELALRAWKQVAHSLKASAFATYHAALDREEQAAAALAAGVRG